MVYSFAASTAGPVSLWYHYSHSYLLDGPDAALELFDPAKGAAVQAFFNNDCYQNSYPDLEEAGASADDLFSQTYQTAITHAAIPLLDNGNCYGNALCQTWIDRMTADYPHLTGSAAKVPILVFYGNNDVTVTPDEMQCVYNRLSGDMVNYQACYDQNPVGHSGVVAENSSYVADWIAYKTLDAAAPAMGNCSALADNDAGAPQLLTEAQSFGGGVAHWIGAPASSVRFASVSAQGAGAGSPIVCDAIQSATLLPACRRIPSCPTPGFRQNEYATLSCLQPFAVTHAMRPAAMVVVVGAVLDQDRRRSW